MKKNTKPVIKIFIILFIIAVVVFILLNIFFPIYYTDYTFVIKEIRDNTITGEKPIVMYADFNKDEEYECPDGKYVKGSELKVGDEIYTSYNDMIYTIAKIEDSKITVTYKEYYSLTINDAIIENDYREKLTASDLKVGDYILVRTKVDYSIKNHIDIANPNPYRDGDYEVLNNVKYIKVYYNISSRKLSNNV